MLFVSLLLALRRQAQIELRKRFKIIQMIYNNDTNNNDKQYSIIIHITMLIHTPYTNNNNEVQIEVHKRFDPIYTDACDRIQVPAGRTHQLRQANEFLGGCLRTSCLMASGFGQMKKGRSVPVCHSGLTICQMGLMNIEIDLNSWRENKTDPSMSQHTVRRTPDTRHRMPRAAR